MIIEVDPLENMDSLIEEYFYDIPVNVRDNIAALIYTDDEFGVIQVYPVGEHVVVTGPFSKAEDAIDAKPYEMDSKAHVYVPRGMKFQGSGPENWGGHVWVNEKHRLVDVYPADNKMILSVNWHPATDLGAAYVEEPVAAVYSTGFEGVIDLIENLQDEYMEEDNG